MLDREQIETLFLRRERALYNVALRWTWNEAEARELVQDAFVRLWVARRRVDEEGANAYLFRTLLNLGQKHARRRETWARVRSLLPMLGEQVDDPEQAPDSERLRRAIAGLTEEHRNVILLTAYSGLKQREIAELLGIPPGTVASRRHQALARLREELTHA